MPRRVGGRIEQATLRDALVRDREQAREVLLYGGPLHRGHLGAQSRDGRGVDAQRLGPVQPARGSVQIAGAERLAGGQQHPPGQRVERLLDAGIVGTQASCLQHQGLGGLGAAGQAARLHACVGLGQQPVDLPGQGEIGEDGALAWCHGRGGRRAVPCALQLRGEEFQPGMGRVRAAGGVEGAGGAGEVPGEQLLLDAREQRLGGPLESVTGLAVAGVADQDRAVELDGVLSLRFGETPLRQRDGRGAEQARAEVGGQAVERATEEAPA